MVRRRPALGLRVWRRRGWCSSEGAQRHVLLVLVFLLVLLILLPHLCLLFLLVSPLVILVFILISVPI
jgi:hypothetical protein